MSKKVDWVDWLLEHGLLLAYTFVMSVVLAVFNTIVIAVVLFISWWDSIR